jgi:hypothetical protein
VLVGDLPHAGVVDGARVGRRARHDELGAEERGGLLLWVGGRRVGRWVDEWVVVLVRMGVMRR